MSDRQDLLKRLDDISGKIEQARQKLKQHDKWHDLHHLSAGELEARHAYLKTELECEVVGLESHGKHVTLLEQSLLNWLHKVDI